MIRAALIFTLLAFGQWPQFRGPDGNGVSTATGLPVTWSETENVKWKTAIHGRAWSSPVVLGRQVWLTTATPDGKQLSALAVDKENGKISSISSSSTSPRRVRALVQHLRLADAGDRAGRVYVTFGSPGTAAIDTATGKVVWERRDSMQSLPRRRLVADPLREHALMHFDGSDVQ